MTTNEIRKKFLGFFASKGHAIVPSDSVIPKNDPTVLFTTAGMQQFKRQFLGHTDDYTRAASSQKCLRTDDLDKVGQTNFHHTFFEMLGNFSFGDYFKKEAIAWAWEFLTKEVNIPSDRLWVSVYKEDPEAEEIWIKDIGIDKNKIVVLGDHSNFWPADAKEKGPNGPCGPCSEIFYDYGINPQCPNKTCDPSCDCGRFSEIWNLVFTQYNRKEGGVLEPLPNKNIDTGMGLERLAAVVQDKESNFETDLFEPIINSITLKFNEKNKTLSKRAICLLSDHIRAVVFGIADGVMPSNEGRGYVIKKLIIDSADIVLRTGKQEPFIYSLSDLVVEAMKEPYPELSSKCKSIREIIQNVEKAYIQVRKERIPELKKEIKGIQKLPNKEQGSSLGETMFRFRDTFGLTIPTIMEILDEQKIDPVTRQKGEEELKSLMTEQQTRSRQGSNMLGEVFTGTDLNLNVPKTVYWGFEQTQNGATILKLFKDNQEVSEANKGDVVKVVIDETPFYAESGGQIGDSGYLEGKTGKIRIVDTKKIGDIYIHIGSVEEGTCRLKDRVESKIDIERRLAIMRNHTATHLLQAALREILGDHVQQQGSLVTEDRLRFDFTHPKAISSEELIEIEDQVNEFIRACEPVTKNLMSIEEARNSGALAFFAEKYGDVVRVVSIGKYSKEFCGGTHLESTGQIGLFKITEESSIAQGIRRLEAKTGTGALSYTHQIEKQMVSMADILKSPKTELVDRLTAQSKKVKLLEKTTEKLHFENIKDSLETILKQSTKASGATIVSHSFKDVSVSILRKVSDLVKQKSPSSIILFGSSCDDQATLLVAVTEDLIKKGIKANVIIKDIAPLINGSGGGRPELAQAGSKETSKVAEAVKKGNRVIQEKMIL